MLAQPLRLAARTNVASAAPSGSFRTAFYSLARRTTDVVTLVNEQGVVQLIAGPVKRTFGVSKTAVVGTSLFSFVRPCDMERVRRALAGCLQQPKRAQAVECRLRASDTNWYQVEPFGTLRRDDPPCGRVLRIRDITARRSMEEVLRQQSDMLQALCEALPVAIVVEDVSGNVRMWSAAAERLFGWRASEVVGRPSPLSLPSEVAAHRSVRDRVLTGITFTALETERRAKDGTVLQVSVSTAPLRDRSGVVRGVLEMTIDPASRSRSK